METGKIRLNVKLERVVNLGTKVIAVVGFPDGEQIEIESFDDEHLNMSEFFKIGDQTTISIPEDAFRFF